MPTHANSPAHAPDARSRIRTTATAADGLSKSHSQVDVEHLAQEYAVRLYAWSSWSQESTERGATCRQLSSMTASMMSASKSAMRSRSFSCIAIDHSAFHPSACI